MKLVELASQIRAARREGNRLKVKALSEEHKELRRKWRKEKRRNRATAPIEPNGTPAPCYFNSGCGIYNEGITNLEIENNQIRLVKWNRENGPNAGRAVYEKGELRLTPAPTECS